MRRSPPPLPGRKKSHKRVLIDLGGNWCVDCVVLANFMRAAGDASASWRRIMSVVTVDVGRFNRNLQIPARFGFTKRLEGRAHRC